MLITFRASQPLVEPAYRQQGIATRLTQLVVEHLNAIGCTKVVLNAAPKARSLYAGLGFSDSNLMELDLPVTVSRSVTVSEEEG